jgi:CBS-domain-containing membrane protein
VDDEGASSRRRSDANVERLEEIVRGTLRRVRLPYLLLQLPTRPVMAAFAMVNGFLSIAIMSLVALVTNQPFVFPSLGPTAFLFFYSPLVPAASPRNTLYGHFIGAAVGWSCLLAFGLHGEGPSTAAGVTWERVLAAGLSLGLTNGLMVLIHAPHPPAGATTLIISLGVLQDFQQVAVLMFAVVLLTLQAIAINRMAGLDYPLWRARPSS